MIRVLLVEDEIYIRKGLISQLALLDLDVLIVGECGTVKDAITLVKSCKPDLVFLDINLDDGNGFDVLDATKDLDFQTVFTTAFDEFALKALKQEAVDYLLKPIDQEELELAVQKTIKRIDSINEQHKELTVIKKDRLILSLFDGLQVIKFKDLLYCKSDKGYTSFYLENGKSFMASKPIKNFETQFVSPKFIRVHQSYIVNLDYVDRYDKSGVIHLINREEIPVSTRRKESFLKAFFAE
ncbi:MAG: LytR/AlgR family response regulator transcription factor [Flavobacteriales bacterium]